jgi:catechol-2,3-dioxygenase
VDMEVSHGNALAIYFFDPDGNRCEVYWNTGLQARQPYLVYVDLDQPPDKIMAEVADSVRQYAGTGYVDPRFLALQDITPGTSASG